MEIKTLRVFVDRVLKHRRALKTTSSGFPEKKRFRYTRCASGLVNLQVILENHLREKTQPPARLQYKPSLVT